MEQLIKSIPLETGQTVNIYDTSKNIAADRWQINIVARMTIFVDEICTQDNDALPPVSEIRQALGETVVFEIKKQRNFVDASEKQKVIDDILDAFTKDSVPYFSRPEFCKRLILRQLHEKKKQFPR